MLRRHGFAAVSTILAIVTVVLLAANLEKAAVFVALAAIAVSLIGGAFNASQRS